MGSRSSAASRGSRAPAAGFTPARRRSPRCWAAWGPRSFPPRGGSSAAAGRGNRAWAARSSATSGEESFAMSRIGRMPVPIPKGVEVLAEGDVVRVKGPKGELANRIPPGLTVTIEETQVRIARSSDEPRDRAFHGLMRSLVANAVQGVTKGFSKDLEIVGVGYKAEVRG